MSYYDHATLMHLKQGPWDPDPYGNERRRKVVRQRRRRSRSSSRLRGAVSLLVVLVGLLVLGATSLGA